MAGKDRWRNLHGGELIDAFEDGTLADLLPRRGGLYLWRRSYFPPLGVRGSADRCREWVHELAGAASARLGKRPLSHCVWLEGLQIGGGGLTDEKTGALESVTGSASGRDVLATFIETLSQFSHPVYVGQADDLLKRIRQHLAGETDLQAYLSETLGLSWPDLDLYFVVLSPNTARSEGSRKVLELFELIAQRLLAPFGTRRPG